MLMLDRGKLVGWGLERMAGRIDGKEWMAMWIWMWIWDCDCDEDGDLRHGQEWRLLSVSCVFRTRPGGLAVLGVCVIWHQQMILQPESIKPSIRNLIQHFEHSQGRVGLTDVGSCNRFPLYRAGGEGRWTGSRFSCRSSCCPWQYVLCKKTGRRREMEHGWQLPSGHSGAESRL